MQQRRWMMAGALIVLGTAFTACSSTPANDFEAGECTNDSLSGDVGEIDTVDCDEAHTAEAFATFDVDGDDFPGTDEIQAQAAEGCQGDRFETYVGVSYQESIFLTTALTPTQETWDNDDRMIICIINGTTDDSALDGSAEGADI
jgi:predicted phage-related endonuclease